jgi:adenylate cyclase
MDNVFSSIASGVIMADIEDKVRLCNRAAESILGSTAADIVGFPIDEILPPMSPILQPHLTEVVKNGKPLIGLELNPTLPERGAIYLLINLSPLVDVNNTTQGVTIVLDDVTEKKRLQAQGHLFERMVSPAVIQQIDHHKLHLGGERMEVTALFADLRGFTSEGLPPELLVSILNKHLAIAVESILGEGGTIDKFLGDAVMAWFNAPLPQPDHPIRAVRAALGIRKAIEKLHDGFVDDGQLSFGIGIHCGEAMLGLVGTEKRMEYTAIGDSINTAKRIQENTGAGQILISAQVYQQVSDHVSVRKVEPILARGKRDRVEVFEVLEMKE